ncbi:accessory factor UbiK family protein [Oecophyllibacter saccharovorans]|uniref:Accessory factor UbiK family protein n=1 Tax=Oecophyllibacter saccharovorans TaxID=2558360 RepID=A0A506UL06_9PROT|nr:accessory factor UbiK family protein [Oecophyllibacter saccharovorans]QDH15200.1 accessory factor UbiK family protein [Oecophyllibacter saccharovorans]TPW33761.1 accessory factor UbiK family protein [Oecophyllibacter saccharovorans]TPW34037.1 accessory factor UbiK family protein [Oecophyllibacter saccharovorans]
MADRPRIFDDLTGLAGTAFSAFSGAREEVHALVQARIDELVNALDLVRRDEFEAVCEMASRARLAEEKLSGQVAALTERVDQLERRLNDSKQKKHHAA